MAKIDAYAVNNYICDLMSKTYQPIKIANCINSWTNRSKGTSRFYGLEQIA